MSNVFDALNEEISRNEKLLEIYRGTPMGAFGAHFIGESLRVAKEARSEMDTIKMITSLESLKENE